MRVGARLSHCLAPIQFPLYYIPPRLMRLSLIHVLVLFASLTYAAQGAETAYLSHTRQLTFEGRRSGEGYFSPDGQKIIFQSEREPGNPFYQIYLLDLASGETHRVSPGRGKTTCSFFRPGTGKVLFASTHLDPRSAELQKAELELRASGKQKRYAWDYDENFDIFEANQDGTEIKRLTTAQGYDAEGSYSPDGSKIVFCSTGSAYPLNKLSPEDHKRAETDLSYFGEIYIMNADGSNQTRLTNTPGYDGGPFFTPDGKRIVWRRFETEGMKADVYTMKLDGSDVLRLTEFGSMSWAPYFHPSGDYLIFASNKLGFENFELFMVDAQGEKEPVRVTFTDGFDGLPVFSPDGKKLCWTSSRAGGKEGQIYLADWNDAQAREALKQSPPRGKSFTGAGILPASSSAKAAPILDPKITEADLKSEIEYLASDALDGRLTGTSGEKLAGDYILERFKKIGLTPLDKNPNMTSEFSFTSGVHAGRKNAMSFTPVEANPHHEPLAPIVVGRTVWDFDPTKDFAPLAFSDNGTTEGLTAFVGYGLVVPGDKGEPLYDSYAGLDVRGRIVIALRYVPEKIPPEKRQIFNRYAGIRYKALHARQRGAAGLILVAGPNSPTSDTLVALDLDVGGASSGILAASAKIETVNRILGTAGKNLKELQTALDEGSKPTALRLDESFVRLTVDLEKETSTGRNIVALLPPTEKTNQRTSDTAEYVAIGAHYDHLGHGIANSSLAHKGEEGKIHFGADDNASGIAAMLEIAEAMVADPTPRKRGIIFAAWSGEELGLLGSAAFCDKPPVPLSRVAAYLNMDMVGRVRDNKLTVQGVGSSKDWRGLIERKNVAAGFSLALSDDPYLPTDATSFYVKQTPTLNFFSGAHDDYHRPTDTADKINYADLVRVTQFVRSVALDLASPPARPAYSKVERTGGPEGGRETLRAYLGTIPDYATEGIVGVKLSGVREGGPADKAGLKAGDVLIEFGGQKIANIYDYTYALDAAKIGEALKVVVQREGKMVTLTVIPEARK